MPSSLQVETVLDELNQAHGHLTPELVLNSALDSDSPLHSVFEWEDSKAAHQHRLWQARKLIRSVRVESPEGLPMSKYISIKIENERHYEEASVLVLDRDKWAVVMEETATALAELERRIETLIQLGDTAGRKGMAENLQADVLAARSRFERDQHQGESTNP